MQVVKVKWNNYTAFFQSVNILKIIVFFRVCVVKKVTNMRCACG